MQIHHVDITVTYAVSVCITQMHTHICHMLQALDKKSVI